MRKVLVDFFFDVIIWFLEFYWNLLIYLSFKNLLLRIKVDLFKVRIIIKISSKILMNLTHTQNVFHIPCIGPSQSFSPQCPKHLLLPVKEIFLCYVFGLKKTRNWLQVGWDMIICKQTFSMLFPSRSWPLNPSAANKHFWHLFIIKKRSVFARLSSKTEVKKIQEKWLWWLGLKYQKKKVPMLRAPSLQSRAICLKRQLVSHV